MFQVQGNNLSTNVCSTVQDIESKMLIRVWTQSKRLLSSKQVDQAKQVYLMGNTKSTSKKSTKPKHHSENQHIRKLAKSSK